jgi:hypothetical protein
VSGRSSKGTELKQCSAWGHSGGIASGEVVMAVVPLCRVVRVRWGLML